MIPLPKFHLTYLVDSYMGKEREAFSRRSPAEVALFLRAHHNMPLVGCFVDFRNECYFLVDDGKPARRSLILKAQLVISRQIGVTIAEFQSYIVPDISAKGAMSPYYSSDLKRLYQYDFTARCLIHDRCVRPSHLVVFHKGHPYKFDPDPIPPLKPAIGEGT